MSSRQEHRFLFVGGLHRSGTTPLARVLGQHPAISGLTETGVKEDEGQHLQDVYPRARQYGGAGRFALAPAAHLTEQSDLVRPDTADRLFRAWEPYWDTSRPVLLEKSPPNLIMGRFLQAVFPGSAMIMVLRHPVVVALSTVKWRRLTSRNWQNHTSVEAMVRHWVRAHELMVEDLASLRSCHVVYYEDLVAQPSEELARIQRWLGLDEPFDSTQLSQAHSIRYEQAWQEMEHGAPWRRRQRRLVEERYAERIQDFGYSLADLRGHSAENHVTAVAKSS